MATSICDFDVILSKCGKDVAFSIDSRPTAILELEEYMDGAWEVANLCKMYIQRVHTRKIDKQKDGKIMQEVYFLSDLEDHTFDF